MANISHFTQTVNGVSTTYDIHDANAIPRSGGRVSGNIDFGSTWDYTSSNQGWFPASFAFINSTSGRRLGFFNIYEDSNRAYRFYLTDHTGNEKNILSLGIDSNNNPYIRGYDKYVAMAEDVVPRSGGAVITGDALYRTIDTRSLAIGGGSDWGKGGGIFLRGASRDSEPGVISLQPTKSSSVIQLMYLHPDGTLTWSGQAIQYTSDQRLKQQITEIDDKLLDAWEDVNLVQFKYNDAVDQKGKDNARLHTGYVVQQIDSACKSHGVDVSAYGLYCHEEYPQETEEVEVEQADGTKTKETKVIREASEHYSLRYTEVYAVECMYLRRCIKQLTARIEQLEKDKEPEASK